MRTFPRVLVATAALLSVASFGSRPLQAAGAFDGAKAYVLNSNDNEVAIFDLGTNTQIGPAIPVGLDPRDAEFSPDGSRLYVVCLDDSSLSVVDTETATEITNIPLATTNALTCVVSPDGARVYVASREAVNVIDTSTNTEVATIPLTGFFNDAIAITPDGSKVYAIDANQVQVISTATNLPVGNPIQQTVFARDAMISDDGSRIVVIGDGPPTLIDTATDTLVPTSLALIGGQRHLDIVGDRAYVTNTGGTLDVYDWRMGTFVESIALAGDTPYGVVVAPDASCAWVSYKNGAQVTVVDLVQSTETATQIAVGDHPRFLTASFSRQVQSFLVPDRVLYRPNTRKADSDLLKINARLDECCGQVDYAQALTVDVNGTPFAFAQGLTANRKGTSFTGTQGGLTVKLRPRLRDTSRGALTLILKQDLSALVQEDGDVAVSFATGPLDVTFTATLDGRRFGRGRSPGALDGAPAFPLSMRIKDRDPDRSSGTIVLGFSGDGTTPVAHPDVTIGIGGFTQTIAGADMSLTRDRWSYRSRDPGVRSLRVDYRKEQITIRLSKATLDLGTGDVLVSVDIGTAPIEITATPRRKGASVTY